MISLPGLIERAARLNPTGVATRCEQRQFTWSELLGRVARMGGALRSLGLDEGDRVALLSLNSDRYYESIFSIPWAGYCVVPLNTRWALAENSYAVDDSGARVLLAGITAAATWRERRIKAGEKTESVGPLVGIGEGR